MKLNAFMNTYKSMLNNVISNFYFCTYEINIRFLVSSKSFSPKQKKEHKNLANFLTFQKFIWNCMSFYISMHQKASLLYLDYQLKFNYIYLWIVIWVIKHLLGDIRGAFSVKSIKCEMINRTKFSGHNGSNSII